MNSNYTTEQRQAVTTDGCDLLVAAAAGSGKTAVLVGRIIRMISEPPVITDVDKLLVVTFTEAAAGEMRARVAEALTQSLLEAPNDDNLRKQLNLLSKASITTIHSFCLRVIRKHFHLLDIDPSFRIADDAEKKLLKAQVIAELFEEEYGREDNEPFFELVESFGGSRTNDGRLEDLIMDTYEFISNYPWPEQWLTEAVARFNMSDKISQNDTQLSDTVWAGIITDELRLALEGVMDSAITAKKICLSEYGPEKYIAAIESDITIISALLDMNIDELYDALNRLSFTRLPSYTAKNRGDTSEELINTVKYIRDKNIKEVVKKCASVFIKEPAELLNDIRALWPQLNTLKRLTLEFQARYSAEKKERNILDFNDLEHFCLKILLDESSTPQKPIPSKAAAFIGEGFHEVLTDEYQDTNLTQELILSSLGRKRFMVGDVKQSIYKFRRAEPELFIRKSKSFGAAGSEQIRIDLSANFRSNASVINAVNFLFHQLMQERTGGISYDDKAALYYGAKFPAPEGGDIRVSDSAELIIIEKDEPDISHEPELNELEAGEISAIQEITELISTELEAKYIAQRIRQLTSQNGLSVYDAKAGSYRAAQYKDIVILLRSARGQAEVIANGLAAYGIPAYANATSGYFESYEVQTMLAILRIVDNPRQDIHLIAVLRSPALYALTSDQLLEIHSLSPSKCFYDCIKEYISEGQDEPLKSGLAQFMRDLNEWRDQAVYTPISALIDNIYEATGLVCYAKAMQGGAVREGNLRLLQERAAVYENTSYKGLFHFIRYIERLQRTRIDLDDVQIASENDNLVRIMTIHKSKGLEFPIVFVSGLGRRFNTSDERKTVIMHQELGFGPLYVDLEKRVRSRSLAHIAIGMRLRAENLAEELRVLYVAATRAKEKLIFTGCIGNYKSKHTKWSIAAQSESNQLPPYYILSAANFLDWLAPAVLRKDFITAYPARFEFIKINKSEIMEPDGLEPMPDMEDAQPQLEQTEQSKDISDWKYPFKEESSLPVKVSISEIKRRYQAEILSDKVVHIPLYGKGKPHGAEIGTALHAVMEHLDLNRHRGTKEIAALISQLAGSNIIDRDIAPAIDIDRIYRFVNGELADRMRASADIRTETRFVLALTPYEVYGKNFSADNNTRIMLHGIIDCFFKENDGWTLVDYKSDRISSPAGIQEIKDRYALQLSLYARAIESRTGMPVNERLLYLFGLDREIRIS